MKLTKRSEYGARAVLELARHFNQGPLQSADIAAIQAIPEAYLEQLLTSLRKSGLIRSTRGPHGGHELARRPAEIRLADVIGALEGPLVAVDCLEDGEGASALRTCVICDVWREVVASARQLLEMTTVEDLVERHKARESRAMYYI